MKNRYIPIADKLYSVKYMNYVYLCILFILFYSQRQNASNLRQQTRPASSLGFQLQHSQDRTSLLPGDARSKRLSHSNAATLFDDVDGSSAPLPPDWLSEQLQMHEGNL